MAKLSTVLAGLLLAAALANAVRQPWEIHHDFIRLFSEMDGPSSFDKVYGPTRRKLEERGLTRLGYRTEPGSIWLNKAADYFLIQYTLAPIVLRAHTNEDEWVLMNYSATKEPFPAADLIVVEDLGNGLALYKRPQDTTPGIPQLGKVWHEREGVWMGTWKRRGDSGVFYAVWKGPEGVEIEDEVRFESLKGQDIVLYRKGTMGRYRGRLSDDGSKVESGQAEWFASGITWAATIEK